MRSLPECEFLSVSPSFKVYLWPSLVEVFFCKRKQNHSVFQLFLLQYCNTLPRETCRLSSDILQSQHLLSTDHFTQNPQGIPSPFSVSTCFRIWPMCRLPALTMMPISSIAAGFLKTIQREKGKYVQIHQAVVRRHKNFEDLYLKLLFCCPEFQTMAVVRRDGMRETTHLHIG